MNLFNFIIPKSSVEYISSLSTVRQAYEKMRYHSYVAIPVLDDEGKYVGTVSNDDLFRHFLESGKGSIKNAEKRAVTDIMKKDYQRPLYHNASMDSLIESVREHNFVPVVDDRGCFIGIILRRDVLNFLFDYYKKHKGED
jgi:CBS domain-containing protein